jgi:hypothetical protein
MRTNTTMKLTTLAGAVALVCGSGAWAGSNTAEQAFDYQTNEVGVIEITTATVSLSISNADVTAGDSTLYSANNTDTSYAITSNGGTNGFKLTATLTAAMPTGNALMVTVAAPDGNSVSANEVALTTTDAVDVVTGIDSVAATAKTITYRLRADLTNTSRDKVSDNKVTYTLVDTGT